MALAVDVTPLRTHASIAMFGVREDGSGHVQVVTYGEGVDWVVGKLAELRSVLDPVAIDWAPDGRLWVVEMADYPLGMDGQGRAGGRVRVLEDTNSDGRYDKAAIFADGLSFPTGLLTWRDGVLVTAAPDSMSTVPDTSIGTRSPDAAGVRVTPRMPAPADG